jgi:hypothetical protein
MGTNERCYFFYRIVQGCIVLEVVRLNVLREVTGAMLRFPFSLKLPLQDLEMRTKTACLLAVGM